MTRVWPVGVLPTVNQDGSGVKSEYRNSFQKFLSNLCMIMKNEKKVSLKTWSSIPFPTLFENLPEEHTDGESDPLETDPAGLPVVFRLQ